MAELYAVDPPGKIYWDRKTYASFEQHVAALKGSRTLYIGNLSFYTTEAQIAELFSKTGELLRVIMGLDRNRRTPCGFAFVEYRHSCDALAAIRDVSGTCLDERIIRAELDPGFQDGRQYGRGTSGGQVRDERNKQYGGVDLARQAPPMDSQEQMQFAAASSSRHKHGGGGGGGGSDAAHGHQHASPAAHVGGRDQVDEFGRALPSKRPREPSVEPAAGAASAPAAAAAAAAAAPEVAAAVAAAAPAAAAPESVPMDAGVEEAKVSSAPEAAAAEASSGGAKKRARDDDADADNDEAAQLSKRSKLDENDMLAGETEAAAADTAAAAATFAAPAADAAPDAAAAAAAPEAE